MIEIKPDNSGEVSVFDLKKARAGALKDSGRHLPLLGHKQQARKELSGCRSPVLPLGALQTTAAPHTGLMATIHFYLTCYSEKKKKKKIYIYIYIYTCILGLCDMDKKYISRFLDFFLDFDFNHDFDTNRHALSYTSYLFLHILSCTSCFALSFILLHILLFISFFYLYIYMLLCGVTFI